MSPKYKRKSWLIRIGEKSASGSNVGIGIGIGKGIIESIVESMRGGGRSASEEVSCGTKPWRGRVFVAVYFSALL